MTRLIDVRVINEHGQGRTDDIIAGLDFALGIICYDMLQFYVFAWTT
jgi:hypothetical protein